ncbi:hypothetical protein L3Q82_022684 [Scortum barcoo]|uniref:Uncharacterized protein n=1 Tax=Scortum barcoo TaxID=214431 RepID=A0ACB8WWI1_9TELE|nr:hypothetical protein L3Q82_022684 [Scortum barcoo]
MSGRLVSTRPQDTTFQGFINEVLHEFLNDFVFVYLDDILIFSPDPVTHQCHPSGPDSPAGAPSLCEGGEMKVPRLLSLIPGFHRRLTQPDQDQDGPGEGWVNAVTNWLPLTSRKKVQRFLGFANFYHKFIRNFSAMAAPLHALTSPKVQRTTVCFKILEGVLSAPQCHRQPLGNHLTWVEYADNMLPTAATGLSPFEVVHGYQPPLFPANEEEVHRPIQSDTTFHVSRLKPVKKSPLVPPSKPPPPKMVDGGPVFAVTALKLLAVRKRGWGRQFLMDWEDYGPEERSWIPASFIVDHSLVDDFYQHHPDVLGLSGAGPKGGVGRTTVDPNIWYWSVGIQGRKVSRAGVGDVIQKKGT